MAQDAWTEVALATVNIIGDTSNYHFGCITDTVNIDLGNRPVEWIASLKGGRIPKFTPEEDTTITLEAYPLTVADDEDADADVDGVYNFMWGDATSEGDGALSIQPVTTKQKVRLVLRWTTETGVDAEGELGGDSGEENLRMIFADGYLISAKPDFTDDILKVTMEFKFTPFDRSGNANYEFQSTDGSGTAGSGDIGVLGAYTTSNKF